MVAKLVAGVGDLEQRFGVELGVEPFDEERCPQCQLLEHIQDAGERALHREVAPERLVFGPQPTLQVGRLPQVVEGHADRRAAASGPQTEGPLVTALLAQQIRVVSGVPVTASHV